MTNKIKPKAGVAGSGRAVDALLALHPAPTPAELAALLKEHPEHADVLREVACDMLELAIMTGAERGDPSDEPTEEEIAAEVAAALSHARRAPRRRPDRNR